MLLIERLLDAGFGACWLKRPDIAQAVEAALLCFDGARYSVLCWLVMPNHVHFLLGTLDGRPLPDRVQSWKSVSAKWGDDLRGSWERDYFECYIRCGSYLAAVLRYMEQKSVKARLVKRGGDLPTGSALAGRRSSEGIGRVPRLGDTWC